MATNRKRASGSPLRLTVSSPTVSGDPVVVGELGGGVALTDYDVSDGKATVALDGVYAVSVKAVNNAGNVAVAEGDAIYFVSGDDPVLSKKSSGLFFGYALEAVTGGQTATIMVRLTPGAMKSVGGNIFVSTEQTGNGSEQSVAHGLGAVPSKVLVVPTEFLSNQSVDITEGTHTATNVLVTVPSGVKYKVWAAR